MPTGPGYSRPLQRSYAMRASGTDRDRSVEVLKAGFAEGRLTYDEFDERLGQVLTARTFERLMELTMDLPVGPYGRLPAHPQSPGMRRPGPVRVALASVILVLWVLTSLIATLHAL